MAPTNPGLWQKIARYAFDDPKADAPYSVRLAEEEGWSAEDTGRVIAEYRRFLYLSQVMEVPLAPPGPIDAAWTRHLTYTRDYWERFVPLVLGGRALHRAWAIVSDRDAQRTFHRAVAGVYRREFGEDPPRDIWVDPRRLDFGELLAVFFVTGFAGGILSFIGGFALSWLLGLEFGGDVKTLPEKVATAGFLFFWGLLFLSPLWAWLVTRAQRRLRTRKRNRGTWSVGWSLSVGSERS